jgi:hypothetical protein
VEVAVVSDDSLSGELDIPPQPDGLMGQPTSSGFFPRRSQFEIARYRIYAVGQWATKRGRFARRSLGGCSANALQRPVRQIRQNRLIQGEICLIPHGRRKVPSIICLPEADIRLGSNGGIPDG